MTYNKQPIEAGNRGTPASLAYAAKSKETTVKKLLAAGPAIHAHAERWRCPAAKAQFLTTAPLHRPSWICDQVLWKT